MSKEIRVPALGESVTEATIAKWFKKEGDAIKIDEPLVELETDKVTVEVPAPASGKLEKINAAPGATIAVGALLGSILEGAAGAAPSSPAAKPSAAPAPAAAPAVVEQTLSPAVRKAVVENNLNPADIPGTGKDGRITKGDVIGAMETKPAAAPAAAPAPVAVSAPVPAAPAGGEERVKMTRLRATIAKRLKDAQNTAAMLTTFNEVDMSSVMAMRNQYKDVFEKKHGTKLGFMSFFVKAVIQALRDVPAVNAEIDGEDIVYKNYYNIGVAVGTDKGLVVPVVRNADMLSFAGIEKTIAGYGKQARDGKLQIADMQGGTFTVTNGGIYGSLMSTPILNAPQSGILGMHAIKDRPIAVNGQVVIRPMMYLALSYDHRIVDGKEAVTFLVRIKDGLEDPQRALLDL
ncbi:2-oxoglutarate dehydrogenase complex dihydrolipoyllysine-residue succinyltransferase [Aestuariivirga litoralis]|uniref:2-oxoglutarate dehydrogenase complex dihydrolipoyllysine-residue succinyltransferase n=1 Tax=Aestuariivirga litoralis TaxID=2650924 RepID=UPI0018C691E3|nr:2-oxoglutarate dehydrogenase complex dihydrolipoyllysine-residue succinyltransferase [Aestuariivirga litoralis]MBG1233626.1 2-oxoglutarate dehydrogenase complex dihydrolipoyllysine-residue succinyltransferase [Aestuariivirga litoralis]